MKNMYGGMVGVVVLPPFTQGEYHQKSLSDISLTIEEKLGHSYESGCSFLRDSNLFIS